MIVMIWLGQTDHLLPTHAELSFLSLHMGTNWEQALRSTYWNIPSQSKGVRGTQHDCDSSSTSSITNPLSLEDSPRMHGNSSEVLMLLLKCTAQHWTQAHWRFSSKENAVDFFIFLFIIFNQHICTCLSHQAPKLPLAAYGGCSPCPSI